MRKSSGFDSLGHLLAAWSAWASICVGTHGGPGMGVGSQVNIARLSTSMPSIFCCWEVNIAGVTWSSPCVPLCCRGAKASNLRAKGRWPKAISACFQVCYQLLIIIHWLRCALKTSVVGNVCWTKVTLMVLVG